MKVLETITILGVSFFNFLLGVFLISHGDDVTTIGIGFLFLYSIFINLKCIHRSWRD